MENTSKYSLLPPLDQDKTAVNPDCAGQWIRTSDNFLDVLPKSFASGGSVKDASQIDSIPDVWARPLLFQMALLDNTTLVQNLSDCVEDEWRCLLAMLALKDVRHLNITAEQVDIRGENSMEDVLRALAPVDTVDENTGWDVLYILSLEQNGNKTPLAMTSPVTLVVAAADYSTAFAGKLQQPWSNDGYHLQDPIDYLTTEDLDCLYSWLKQLHRDLQNMPEGTREQSSLRNKLMERISDFEADIVAKYPQVHDGEEIVDADLEMHRGVFRLLNRMVQGKIATAEDSAVRIIPSVQRHPRKELLLISPDMVRSFAQLVNVPETRLVVWPGISANDVTDNMLLHGRNVLGSTSLGMVEFRRPEDFFTENIVVLDSSEDGNEPFPGSLHITNSELLTKQGMVALLPIRQELLEYFTPQEIANRISYEVSRDQIVVKFAFPLSGIGGHQADYRFRKIYRQDKWIYLDTNKPVVEIWPNFRREGWNKYYLYYENSEVYKANTETLGKDFFYINPWSNDADLSTDVPDGGLTNCFTARMNGFPEALLCTVNTTLEGKTYPEKVDAGVILLKQLPMVDCQMELKWQIGVDFGTSSTMLYRCQTSGKPEPLSFEPHLFQVTNSGASRGNTFVRFIPSIFEESQKDGSFLSIFHMLNMGALHDTIHPLKDGHIFLLTERGERFYNQEKMRLDTNLKWHDDDIGRRKVSAYITQLCLQSLAEAAARGVDKLEWNFSFPTAFSQEQKEAFETTCRIAVQDAEENTCYDSGEDDTIESWPESKAAAYHFNKLNGNDTNFVEGAVCLDIGAGTTDISIISGQPGRIIYHTSIQFAGRYLFHPIYRHYDEFTNHKKAFDDTALLDADMREHSEEYLRDLHTITGHPNVKQALQQSQFGLAGIFHYVGDLLKNLHDRGIYLENHVPDIFVGGNGARILSWVSGGSFKNSSPYMDVLKDSMRKAADLDPAYKFGIYMSAQPKVEVASGMIEERPNNDEEFFNEEELMEKLFGKQYDPQIANAVYAGAQYTKDGKQEAGGTFISAEDIQKGLNVTSVDELKDFIKVFNGNNHTWANGIKISADQLQRVQKNVNGYYVAEKGKPIKKIFVEPVFIMELKKAMEVL